MCSSDLDMQTQQYLCEQTYKDKESMTRLIDSLEKNGYVIRRHDPNDRRSNLIHLTTSGRDLEQIANNIIFSAVELATKDVDKDEFIKMFNLFKKIINNIEQENNN